MNGCTKRIVASQLSSPSSNYHEFILKYNEMRGMYDAKPTLKLMRHLLYVKNRNVPKCTIRIELK